MIAVGREDWGVEYSYKDVPYHCYGEVCKRYQTGGFFSVGEVHVATFPC